MSTNLSRLLGRGGARHSASSTETAAPPRTCRHGLELLALQLQVRALLAVAPIAKAEDPPLQRLRQAGEAGIDPATLRPSLLLALAELVEAGAVEACEGGRLRLSPSKVAAIDRDAGAEAAADARQIRATLRARREGDLAAVVADPRHHPVLALAAASQGTTLAELLVDFMAISDGAGREVLRCRFCGSAGPVGDGRAFKVAHAAGCAAAG